MWRKILNWVLLAPPHSFLDELKSLRFWVVLAVLIAGSHQLSKVWPLDYAGYWAGDRLANVLPPETSEKTSVVFITVEERKKLLGGISPIPVSLLEQTVCAILKTKPAVLGIDLDTAQVPVLEPRTSSKLVWARGLTLVREMDHKGAEHIRVDQNPVLGRAMPDVLNGLAAAPVAEDWSVRTIPLCYEYDEGRVMPTMVAMLAKAAGRHIADCQSSERAEEESAVRIHYQFDRFTLSDFSPANLDQAAIQRCQMGKGEWSPDAVSKHPLKGRVVVLGGEYDAQDWHPTPFGLKPGVEVTASLTEHLLRESGAHHFGFWTGELPWKLSLALIVAWIHTRCRPLAALTLSVVGLAGLVFAGGLLAVYFTSYRATTVPFLLGIVIEQLATSAERAQENSNNATSHRRIASTNPAGGARHP